jgi:hypothetical protein
MSTAQSITDALAGLDHAQGDPGTFGLGPAHELAALRDLADAVRAAQRARYDEHAHCAGCGAWMKAGHGPGCWVGTAEQAEAVRAGQAAPVVGVTEHDGYTVRAVITTAGRTSAWFVAAEHPSGKWATWRAEQGDGGTLGFSQRQLFAKRAGLTAEDITRDLRGEPEVFRYGRERNRANALTELAMRSGIVL